MVHVDASMAQAASTAFPPFVKMMDPAVAARGLPVMAIQFLPCKGGFCVGCAKIPNENNKATVVLKIIFFIWMIKFC
jgi:hypothetical protein